MADRAFPFRRTLGVPCSPLATVATLVLLALATAPVPAAGASFAISYPEAAAAGPLDGRVILVLSTSEEGEPRFEVGAGVDAVQLFGVDVEALAPGREAVVDGSVFGYPYDRLGEVPAGRYRVQAVLHRYETFHRADGHVVKLPMDRGEGQHWNRAPGNLYSEPRWVDLDPASDERIAIALDREIEPIEPPKCARAELWPSTETDELPSQQGARPRNSGDYAAGSGTLLGRRDQRSNTGAVPPECTQYSEYVKHIRIRSELLSRFWGRDMYLGAHVLLPAGFDQQPDARYPLMVFHGHFPSDFGGFRTEPPDPDLECAYSDRFQVECYNRVEQQEAYDFYRQWTSPGFPPFLVVEIQHANPFYDDSYAVNSANLGPYGDAINHELIPEIERRFRGVGEGWGRFLYGGSTGGWEALAVQVFYPDEFNGTFAACPDPIDFRAYTSVNVYDDANAYYAEGPFRRLERPAHRDWLGHIQATVEDYNHMELALGTKGRSGDQFDIWEAVYSPVGEDGYPKRIWDKESGEIDPEVAAYWREHYDLRHVLERDWAELGPKLAGKIHVYVGDMDNYYLNDAVYLMEDFLESTEDPYYGGVVDYGDRAEHCWNGDQEHGNHLSRLRYNTMYLPEITKRLEAAAPEGFDLEPWRRWVAAGVD